MVWQQKGLTEGNLNRILIKQEFYQCENCGGTSTDIHNYCPKCGMRFTDITGVFDYGRE